MPTLEAHLVEPPTVKAAAKQPSPPRGDLTRAMAICVFNCVQNLRHVQRQQDILEKWKASPWPNCEICIVSEHREIPPQKVSPSESILIDQIET
jgi:hypothetical protein